MTRQALAQNNPSTRPHGTTQRALAVVGLAWALLLALGCPPENYPDVVPPTQEQIARIHDDATLTPQEQRLQLEALGLSPLTINFVLSDKPLGNQFGGDLRTAYFKMIQPNLEALTPDEVQIYASGASAVQTSLNIKFTDAQAQDIVDFFASHDLLTPTELAAFLTASPDAVPSSVTADNLRAIFVTFDPALVLPILP